MSVNFFCTLTVYYENKGMTLFERSHFRFYYADYTLLKIYPIVPKIWISLQFLKLITFPPTVIYPGPNGIHHSDNEVSLRYSKILLIL